MPNIFKIIVVLSLSCTLFGQTLLENPANLGHYEISEYTYSPVTNNPEDPMRTDIYQYFSTPDQMVKEQMDNVPISGIGHIPIAKGSFPLVIIFHGNHTPLHPSHEGYGYLTKLLASHGIITISIDGNFLNGRVSGEMDARAILLLRHLQRFREWNRDSQHPLFQKIDMERIGLAGHSRGGEAITVANLFNDSLHNEEDSDHNFQFKIKGLFAIAPVDGQIGKATKVIVNNCDYFVMHGSHDGDVYSFAGLKTYNRAFPIDKEAEGFKSLLFVHGANHNYWNSVWEQYANDASSQYGMSSPFLQITAEKQQVLAKIFMSAFFQWNLLGKQYKSVFTQTISFSPKDIVSIQQYSDREHIDLNNYEEDEDSSTGSFNGVSNSSQSISKFEEKISYQTRSAYVTWNSNDATYEIELPKELEKRIDSYPYLSMRVGQVHEKEPKYNPTQQDLSLGLKLGKNVSELIKVSKFTKLIAPVPVFKYNYDISKTNMQTVRIPIISFFKDKLPLQNIKIRIQFANTPSGFVVIDDIQLSK